MAPRGPVGPRLPVEVSVQADMEQQHMEHITQETTRRWYAGVLVVFISVSCPSGWHRVGGDALAAGRLAVSFHQFRDEIVGRMTGR